jgi:hypothetical protein
VVLPFDPIRASALPSIGTGPFEPLESSPKPGGSPLGVAKAVPTQKISYFQVLGCLGKSRRERQKGLVDHVCPATFSQSARDRKVPLTIVT